MILFKQGRYPDEEQGAYDGASRYRQSRENSVNHGSDRYGRGQYHYSENGQWGHQHPGDYYNHDGATTQAGYAYGGYPDEGSSVSFENLISYINKILISIAKAVINIPLKRTL